MRASVAAWERQRSRPLWVAAVVLWSGLLGSVVPALAGLLHEGDILVTAPSGIVAVDPTNGAVTPFSSFLAGDITARDGQILAASGSTIFRLDPNTGAATPFSSGNLLTQGVLAVDLAPSGKIFALTTQTIATPNGPSLIHTIVTIDPLTGAQQFLFSRGLDLNDLAGAVSGELLVTANRGDFFRINPDTGTPIGFGVDVDHNTGLAAALNGDIAIAGIHDIFYNLSPVRLKTDTSPCGQFGGGALAFGPHNELYALTNTLQGLIQIDTQFVRPDGCSNSVATFTSLASPSEVGSVGRIAVFVPFPTSLWLLVMGIVVAAVARREWMKHL